MSKKRTSTHLDSSSHDPIAPRKRRKCIIEDEKDSENDDNHSSICDLDMNAFKTITINGQSAQFRLSDLIRIDFFKTRYSTNWNQNMSSTACEITGDSIHFGMEELKVLIQFLSSSSNTAKFNTNVPRTGVLNQMNQSLGRFLVQHSVSPLIYGHHSDSNDSVSIPVTPETADSDITELDQNTNDNNKDHTDSLPVRSSMNSLNLSVLIDHDLFCPNDNFLKLRSFINCLDFFCIPSLIDEDTLCTLYHQRRGINSQSQHHQNGSNDKISISDLDKMQRINHPVVHSIARKLVDNAYASTVHQRVLSLKSNILKFQINDDGFSVSNQELDESEWFRKKMNEFALFRRHLSRDWLLITESHQILQNVFISDPNGLRSILTATKSILDTFCRFCTMTFCSFDGDPRRKSNILNDVKLCTFPMIQLFYILMYFITHFDAVWSGIIGQHHDSEDNTVDIKQQTVDLVLLLPTILKCGVFCGFKKVDKDGEDRYKDCDRRDDMRFMEMMQRLNDSKGRRKESVYGMMVDIYEQIIDLLMDGIDGEDESASRELMSITNDISIVESLVLSVAEEVMDDEQWIEALFKKCKQREAVLLAVELRRNMIDRVLGDGPNVRLSYLDTVQRYLSHKIMEM